ncbi:MAG: hypothetical protein AB8B94_12065 [Hyphomicrobiales bacterium]
MSVRRVRIIHVEDDWEQFRTVPNNLFDAIYVRSDPEVRITIDFEESQPENGAIPDGENIDFCYLWRAFVGDPVQTIFEYYFVDTIEALRTVNVQQDDFYIVDIMQAGEDGMPVSVVEEAQAYIASGTNRPMGMLYFSAYPEYNSQKNLDLDGFDKSKLEKLLASLQQAIFSQFQSFDGLETEGWKLTPMDIGMTSRLDEK